MVGKRERRDTEGERGMGDSTTGFLEEITMLFETDTLQTPLPTLYKSHLIKGNNLLNDPTFIAWNVYTSAQSR